MIMAEMLRPSFVAFFDQLSEAERKRHRSIGEELKDAASPEIVLQMFATHDLEPYQVLARSIQGASPASHEAFSTAW